MTTEDSRQTPDRLIRDETSAERARLVGLLTDLDPTQWATPSLCAGWRIREVVAHMTMAYRLRGPRFFLGLARSGFRFNAFADRIAKDDTSRLTDAQLLASLRENIDNPWKPPGGGPVGALSHDVIHGLDITEALGLPSPPPERIRLVLDHAGEKNLSYFGTDLSGLRLIAEDVDPRSESGPLTIGPGPNEIRVSAADLLLTVTGRLPLPED